MSEFQAGAFQLFQVPIDPNAGTPKFCDMSGNVGSQEQLTEWFNTVQPSHPIADGWRWEYAAANSPLWNGNVVATPPNVTAEAMQVAADAAKVAEAEAEAAKVAPAPAPAKPIPKHMQMKTAELEQTRFDYEKKRALKKHFAEYAQNAEYNAAITSLMKSRKPL